MYEYLEGRVARRRPGRLIVDVAGVGYELFVPLRARFPSEGDPVRAFAHLVVREDLQSLYGFADEASRDLFRLLLKVRGVGPTMALGVLSGLDEAELCQAILDGDVKTLCGIKGVGKKTAEQIVLDLKDRAEALLGTARRADAGDDVIPRPERGAQNVEDATAALISVGYTPKDAKKQVERAARSVDPNDLEELVRCALRGA